MAEIFFDDIQWAELSQEQEALEVEFYRRPYGQPWRISFVDATAVLDEARRRLIGKSQKDRNSGEFISWKVSS